MHNAHMEPVPIVIQEASKSVKQDRASVLIQALVSALTEGLRFAGVGSDRSGKIASAERTPTPTTLNELKTRLVVDFENAYFVTGTYVGLNGFRQDVVSRLSKVTEGRYVESMRM